MSDIAIEAGRQRLNRKKGVTEADLRKTLVTVCGNPVVDFAAIAQDEMTQSMSAHEK